MVGRRAVLRALATGGVAAALASARRLRAVAAAGPGLGAVEHVVIFSQENRSFDHYCGTYPGARGWADPHPLRQPNGESVLIQRDATGVAVPPFRPPDPTTRGQCIDDVNHDWRTSVGAVAGGRMDAWVRQKGRGTMACYARPDIPYFFALADAFTLCDAYFCSFNGPTNPNRLFMMTGTIDPGGRQGGPATDNDEPGFSWTTYPERLQRAGVSWRVYQETDNFDDNALAWFTQFRGARPSSPLAQNGLQASPPERFAADVAAGALPAVAWILSPTRFSEHPPSSPSQGQAYGARFFLDALAAAPEVWRSTIFIWTYDENGGLFDHVVPPMPPPGTPDETSGGTPLGLGARVPTLVLSPWSRGGWICSEVFDHTSLLRLLEVWTGVAEPNISGWRRKVCGDLTSAFDFAAPVASFPTLGDARAAAERVGADCGAAPSAPPSVPATPAPEPGVRPLRPLPYRLWARLTPDPAARLLRLQIDNRGPGAAAVHVHHFAGGDAAPVHLTIGARQAQARALRAAADGRYDVELHGPNGFFRRWAGTLAAPGPEVAVASAPDGLWATLTNSAGAPVRVRATSPMRALPAQVPAADVPAGGTAVLALALADGWYDYDFRVDGDGAWLRQAAGHEEGPDGRTRPT